ncbi:MAG: hypothetical protein KJO35_04775 [Gammaproteobacteria bacterium]|nr:hypothetical protein [Gammaproteobacteria bacterium]
MDVSGVSAAVAGQGESQAGVIQPAVPKQTADEKSAGETRQDQSRDQKNDERRALQVFRQELRVALRARFQVRLQSTPQAYTQLQQADTPNGIANETLAAARQIANESPAKAANAIIKFKAEVKETATYVREIIGNRAEDAALDQTVSQIDRGLDALGRELANVRESSASVLSVDTRSKQRTTIQIRTQEGDIVKFDLKRSDKMSAGSVSVANDNSELSLTEIALSGKSKLKVRVKGDLNDSELAAIRNVFAQAEEIANNFFGGDLAAALGSAQDFQFDGSQLERVNMRFKLRESSKVTYAASGLMPQVATPQQVTSPATSTAVATNPAISTVPGAPPAEADVASSPFVPAQPDATGTTAAPVLSSTNSTAVSGLLNLLSDFLAAASGSFESKPGQESFRFSYSESFKLQILSAVIHTAAADSQIDAATKVGQVIEGINSVTPDHTEVGA